MRLGFTHFPIAHVKSNYVAAIPRYEAAHTRGGVHQTAALPLTDMDRKRPEVALIENKGTYLVVLIMPVGKHKRTFIDFFFFLNLPVPVKDHWAELSIPACNG